MLKHIHLTKCDKLLLYIDSYNKTFCAGLEAVETRQLVTSWLGVTFRER